MAELSPFGCYPLKSGVSLAVLPGWEPYLGRESAVGLHAPFSEYFCDGWRISVYLVQVTAASDPFCRQGKSVYRSHQGYDI